MARLGHAGARQTVPLLFFGALLTGCGEPLPALPERPLGPDSVEVGRSARYRFFSLPERTERVAYVVSWQAGARETTGFVRGGDTVALEHAWADTGRYDLAAQALTEESALSGWSEPRVVRVYLVNSAPPVPSDSGPDTLQVNDEGQFRAQATDPDADRLTYVFDWGNGTSQEAGEYASGAVCRLLHAWADIGRFPVRVRARDEHGALGDWSAPHEVVVMP